MGFLYSSYIFFSSVCLWSLYSWLSQISGTWGNQLWKWKWKLLSHVRLFATPWAIHAHGILHARILEWVAIPFSKGSSQPRDQTQVSHIVGRFFTSWATGKPKNTGVSSLSLLQWIFLTQESNQCLLHCRQILYQLSYQGSPQSIIAVLSKWRWGCRAVATGIFKSEEASTSLFI